MLIAVHLKIDPKTIVPIPIWFDNWEKGVDNLVEI